MAFICDCYIEVDYPCWQRDDAVERRALNAVDELRKSSVKGLPVIGVLYHLDDSVEVAEIDRHFERYFGITLVLDGDYILDFLLQDTRLYVTSDVRIILCGVQMPYTGRRDNLVAVGEKEGK